MRQPIGFSPIPRQRLSDDLAERILSSIAAGELRPGDRLPTIQEMARSFRVAPTTLREALVRLEEKRVLEIRHGTGVFVAATAA